MTLTPQQDKALARQARIAAVVIAVAMLGWMGVNVLGGKLGLETRFAFLADFVALAAFVWALVVTIQIWRKRRANEGS